MAMDKLRTELHLEVQESVRPSVILVAPMGKGVISASRKGRQGTVLTVASMTQKEGQGTVLTVASLKMTAFWDILLSNLKADRLLLI
jgi:hypothetical protein